MTDEQIAVMLDAVTQSVKNRPMDAPLTATESIFTGAWPNVRDHIDAQAAEIARLRERLTQAIERLRDMLQGDDGQAWDEAQRFVDIIAQETQP